MYNCPLCISNSQFIYKHKINKKFYREFYFCECCCLIFVPKEFHISEELEAERYNLHNWDLIEIDEIKIISEELENTGKLNSRNHFFAELSKFIVDFVNSKNVGLELNVFKSLDIGCGKFPNFSKIFEYNFTKFKQNQYNIETYNYDICYFKNQSVLLDKEYNLITSFEVLEHLRDSKEELIKTKSMLKKDGIILIETQLLDNIISTKNEFIDFELLQQNFSNWWYKNDITHINFYSKKL